MNVATSGKGAQGERRVPLAAAVGEHGGRTQSCCYQTQTQPEAFDYELDTLWFCGDCTVSFGQDKALLSLTGDGARLSMTTDERQLTLPLSLEGGALMHNDIKPHLTAVPEARDLNISQWQATGGFFGPEAEEAGLIFSLFYDQSVFSAAGIGQKIK